MIAGAAGMAAAAVFASCTGALTRAGSLKNRGDSTFNGRQGDRRDREDDQSNQTDVRDPRPLRRGPGLHQLEHNQGQPRNEQRLERDGDENLHYCPPLAFRARAIISSILSSSSSLSLSDIPRSALAALAGSPLKKTRTISLNADFLATEFGQDGAVDEAAIRFGALDEALFLESRQHRPDRRAAQLNRKRIADIRNARAGLSDRGCPRSRVHAGAACSAFQILSSD